MFSFFYKKIQVQVSMLLVAILFISSVALIPLSPQGKVQNAEAFLSIVTVAGGTGTVQQTLSAASNAVVAGIQDAFFIKEFTLDGILNGLAKMILKSMTQSILTWINSGFEGNPAFVTDLKQFMLDRADQVAGDFIYNDPNLNFLCSPFQLDVKIALATTYQEGRDGGFNAQCTLSEVSNNVEGFLNGSFNDGGWASWFEVTQNTVNTPTGAYLAAEGELRARITDAEGNTVRELEWNKGFLSFKVCSEAQKASGNLQNCKITTPGAVIADQINKSLGAGQDALIAADEIDEIIGAFFAQLAKQAITGINGLLGLGASSYSDNSFGPDKNRSFFEELQDEQTAFGSPFETSVTAETENMDLQNLIITTINDVQTILDNATNQYGSCIGIEMPQELQTPRENAILQLIISSSTVSTLQDMDARFVSEPDPYKKLEVIDTYNQMITDGLVKQSIDNRKLEVFIKSDLTDMTKKLESKVSSAKNKCADET